MRLPLTCVHICVSACIVGSRWETNQVYLTEADNPFTFPQTLPTNTSLLCLLLQYVSISISECIYVYI